MKRRFDFRLARLLRVRAIEERTARSVWALAENEARRADGLCDQSRAQIAAARAHVRSALEGSLRPRRILLAQRSVEALLEQLRRRRERALTLRDQARRLHAAWNERERGRRSLAELEQRQRARHRAEVQRADDAELDEAARLREARARLARLCADRDRVASRKRFQPREAGGR